MIHTLEEIHRATMTNPRAEEVYGRLVRPGEKLCVVVWDSTPIQIQKPGNHKDQRATWSTKIHGNCMNRMEAADLEGRPVFRLVPTASTSPRATDESICYFQLQLEMVTGLRGGMRDMLIGLPGYTMVHLWDNGFR